MVRDPSASLHVAILQYEFCENKGHKAVANTSFLQVVSIYATSLKSDSPIVTALLFCDEDS